MMLTVRCMVLVALLAAFLPGYARADPGAAVPPGMVKAAAVPRRLVAGGGDGAMLVLILPETIPVLPVPPGMAMAAAVPLALIPDGAPGPLVVLAIPELMPMQPVPAALVTDPAIAGVLVASDDSGIIWVRLPGAPGPAATPGLFDLDARQLMRDPVLAQATATRAMNTIASLADNHRYRQLATVIRFLNDGQQTAYTRLRDWYERNIRQKHIDVHRERDEVAGGFLYVVGYRGDF